MTMPDSVTGIGGIVNWRARPSAKAAASHVIVLEQAAENMGWGRAGGGAMWGNVAEAPGKPFSRSGARLAHVLYIHYLSKVPTHLQGQPA